MAASALARRLARDVIPERYHARLSSLAARPQYPGRFLLPDTEGWTHRLDALARTMNAGEAARRRRLARALPASPDRIAPERGFAIVDWDDFPEFRQALAHAQELAAAVDWAELEARSKKPFLINQPIDITSPRHADLAAFVLSDRLLGTLSAYLGSVPVLAYVSLQYSPNTAFHEGRSQQFHLDGEAVKSLKCYAPLREITADSGPLTVIPADESLRIHRKLVADGIARHQNEKISDEDIARAAGGEPETHAVIGRPGQAGIVDTCRCYHYGSRPGRTPRMILFFHFMTPFAKDLPMWNRERRALPAHLAGEKAEQVLGLTHQSVNYEQYVHRMI